jgi:type II secretory pathway pseudopilin PulG
MRPSPSCQQYCKPRATGFTYIGLLILIAILGMATAATLQVGALLQRRAAEQELLAIGLEMHTALTSYAAATPVGQSAFPATLEDLLLDPRYPGVRRHLRRVYLDPITRNAQWGLVMSANGQGIAGIYSLSEQQPIKLAHFAPPFANFENKSRYRDWVFAAVDNRLNPRSVPPVPDEKK